MSAHYTQTDLRLLDELAEFHMTREDAENQDCPYCGVEAGQTCVRPDTGEAVPYPAHWQRIPTTRR